MSLKFVILLQYCCKNILLQRIMDHKIEHSSSNLGLVLSIACAIHCMMMPVLIMAFPLLNESALHHPVVEWSILIVLILLGLLSLNHYRKVHHNKILPTWIFIGGVVLFTTSLLIDNAFHHALTIAGSLVIALSHGVNLSLKRTIPTS